MFAEEGADVCISYRSDLIGAEEVQGSTLRRSAEALYADFSNESDVNSFFNNAISFLGSLDILINNAGGYDTSAFFDVSAETFKNLFTIGVSAPRVMTQLAAKKMIECKQSGSIINISSISGQRLT